MSLLTDIVGKDPKWYLVQEGDATMFIMAFRPGQKIKKYVLETIEDRKW